MTKDQQPSQGLLPCPFCGEGSVYRGDYRGGEWSHYSEGCFLSGVFISGQHSIEQWNTRAAPHSTSEGRATILADEVSAVHDALGYLENFEVREPDLHLTRVECRAILRDAAKHLRGGSNE